MADQAKGKEDKEDGEDYSEVIEVLKQHIKSYKRDSVSAIKNISSTLASLTNSSNATTTGKTSYSPRFDPFSGTIDLDSPSRPPRKEPHLGPAVDNTATSNLDPPIDTGSKEGFKDTITSSIVKELSKKAYTIPDNKNSDISNTYSDSDQAVLLMLLRDSLSSSPRAAISRPIESKKEDVYNEFYVLTFSTYRKGLSAFNAEFNGYLAKLTMAKIDIDPSLILNQYFKALESKFPSWAYRAAYIANSSNSTPNSNSNPSKKGKNKKKGKKKASYNIEGQNYSAKSAEQASFMLGSYNLAIEEEVESDSSSNSRYKKRKDFKGKGLKTSSNKAKYKDNQPRRRPRDPALYNSWLYDTGSIDHISNSKERFTTFTPNTGQLRPINTGNSPVSPAGIGSIILEVLSRKAPPTYTKLVLDNVLYLPNIDINIVSRVRYYDSGGCFIKETLYGGNRRYIAVLDFKKSGFFLDVKGSSKPILHANFAFPLGLSSYTTKSIEPQCNKIVVEIPSNSIRKEDYRPIIEDAIVSEAIEPNKRYKLRNSPAKGTTLEVIEGNKVVEKAISSLTLKEPNIGQRDYYNLLNLAKLWHVRLGHIGLCLLKKTSSITKGLPNFDKIKEADFHCSSCDRGKAVRRVSKALIPDPPRVLDLIEGDTVKIRPRPYNRNPIVLLLVNRKKECKLLAVLGSKTYLVYILSRRAVLKTSTVNFIEDNTVLSQPTDNTALEGELVDLDLDLEGAVSLDPSNFNTEKPISIEIGTSKLEPYESSSDKLGVFKFLPRSLLPSNRKLITYRNVLKVKKDAKNRPIKYKSRLVARGFMQVEGLDYTVTYASTSIPPTWRILLAIAASNKAIYKLLLKYSYNPSTPNIIKLSKALYGVFYNAKTCHFIVTYIDDCLFIGPDIGYITDLKKRLNKVYAIEDLGPAAYFLGV
ncbi:hypothetical protein P8C59_003848 [Phyllachora maydis]|uniref:Reverse transcriptase Ty1/copia-type domain-containing protein n=1 Tax=Phyllachora maydis TaxID=1825666 RepID=A0AAD9I1A1_9PEZI|nr:hypothetical protein P8C59_003848 [Phyllachora maydis]